MRLEEDNLVIGSIHNDMNFIFSREGRIDFRKHAQKTLDNDYCMIFCHLHLVNYTVENFLMPYLAITMSLTTQFGEYSHGQLSSSF